MEFTVILLELVVLGIVGGFIGWFSRGQFWVVLFATVAAYVLLIVADYAYFSRPGSLTLDSLRTEIHVWSINYPRYFWMHPAQEIFGWVFPFTAILAGALLMQFVYKRSRRHEC